jgi:hypothetical protein
MMSKVGLFAALAVGSGASLVVMALCGKRKEKNTK